MKFISAEVKVKEDVFRCLKKSGEENLRNIKRLNGKIEDMVIRHYADDIRVVAYDFSPLTFLIIQRYSSFDSVSALNSMLTKLGYEEISVMADEETTQMMIQQLRRLEEKEVIDSDEILEETGLYDLINYRGDYRDKLSGSGLTKEEAIIKADMDNLPRSFKSELTRVFDCPEFAFMGHPCHYLMTIKNGSMRTSVIRTLISSLYGCGRIPSTRYTIVNVARDSYILDYMYSISEGATMVLKINGSDISSEGNIRSENFDLDRIAAIVKRNCAKVLTIFSVDSDSVRIRDLIMNALGGLTLVTFSEDSYSGNVAADKLKKMAEADGLMLSEDYINKVKNDGKSYYINSLREMYSKYRHNFLSENVYSGYAAFKTEEYDHREKASDAYSELSGLIGLKEAKKVINDAINYFKMQKEMRRRNITCNRPCMHMIFSGDPGTCKTTVARLVARILKDCDILSGGEMIEVGRADIVGKYVGSTAPLVKEAFKKATGSVLFIDEAYSLVDDRDGLYGDEAINQIVQEMENHRDDVLVIFAGYEDKMKAFLDKNPGLSSRIAFHVHFDNYSPDELYDILKLTGTKGGFTISDDARETVTDIFKKAGEDRNFGNGRFARNLFEKAKFSLSSRLAGKNFQDISDAELTTLTKDDFVYEKNSGDGSKLKIGFCA